MTSIKFQLPNNSIVLLDAELVGNQTTVSYTRADGTVTYAHRLPRNGKRFTVEQMVQRALAEHALEVFRGHVSRGVCPLCGSRLRRFLSMPGWWQCEQLGAVGFRRDATRPSCRFQGFTESLNGNVTIATHRRARRIER